ncbi:MAG: nickel-dependent lactate racemase [Anaerolineae bacterium]
MGSAVEPVLYRIPYGKGAITFTLPPGRQADVLAPADVPPVSDPRRAVSDALAAPVGGVSLAAFATARSVAIAINDKTRPVPHDALLPPLLAALEALGIQRDAITLIIAAGAHPPMTRAEFGQVVPQAILEAYRVVCHDCDAQDALVDCGVTPRGTPVWINRRFAEADLRIVVGNIEPHQFQGYSGGVKSAAIGLAGRETINRNHALMTAPGAELGCYEGNPAREDVEAIGRLAGVQFALNAVLNRHKQIVAVVAGAPQAVMQAGIPLAEEVCTVPVDAPFDLVVASPGGHPKDLNLYQAQKALAHAALVTRPGGMVILAAACPEGAGSRSFERWVQAQPMQSPQEVIDRFVAEGFRVGPHKAYQIARDAARVRVRMVSELPPTLVRQMVLTPVESLQDAVDAALSELPADARIGIMPAANATVPRLRTRQV